MRPEVKVQHRN